MEVMKKVSKRGFLTTALGLGGIAAARKLFFGGSSIKEAYGQILKTGINPDSVLAKMKKRGELNVGYSQTSPFFYRDVKTNKLSGIYYDVAEKFANAAEVKLNYKEISWNNATVGLRKGDFDIFVSSLVYTMPRSLVINYTAPYWHKGFLAIAHKDNKNRFKTAADFNHSDVIFSVNVGSASENILRNEFPKAKIISTSGQIVLAAEPVRTKKAHLWISGDLDALVFAAKNSRWAYAVDPEHPFRMLPNTWAIRYGDPDWKFFLNMWVDRTVHSGFVQERYDHYKSLIIKG